MVGTTSLAWAVFVASIPSSFIARLLGQALFWFAHSGLLGVEVEDLGFRRQGCGSFVRALVALREFSGQLLASGYRSPQWRKEAWLSSPDINSLHIL